jgi:Ca-activated chloride channel family protein
VEATPVSFVAAERLWLLVLVVGLAAFYVALQLRRRQHAVRFTNVDLLASVAPARAGWRRHAAAGALLLSLAFFVAGFARPSHLEKVPRQEATVVLAIDTSASMEATDVAPSRLAAAQQAATSFAEQLPSGFRLGLVSFNGSARVVVSPTTDHQAVADAIGRLRLGTSTAAGEAVYTSLDLIRATTTADPSTRHDAARIVLMSDGATTVGRPVSQAALAAKDAGVPVSTIAFGTEDGTVAIDARLIPVPVDKASMEELARDSGGKSFSATTGKELKAVYRDIRSAIGYTTETREISATLTGVALLLALAGIAGSLAWSGRIL